MSSFEYSRRNWTSKFVNNYSIKHYYCYFSAYRKIESFQKSRDAEVAQLQAMLRKADMRVNNLERTVDQKTQENTELTAICDELIAKVGK